MKYISVCSGIEAVSVAWHDIMKPRALCEFEAFPSAVLAHHYPDVPNMGDLTKWPEWPEDILADADILVGGTPCQAFSVAGLRASLADDRGNLSLEFVRLANAIDNVRLAAGREPGIVLWENVPGVLSVKDNAFGCFLAALAGEDTPLVPTGGRWTNAGVVIGPKRAIAWRILDAQFFGLAQRRRRVFVVASARKDFDPAAVLLEFEGVRRDSAPCRKTPEAASPGAAGRAGERSHWDGDGHPHPTLNQSAKASGGVGASNQELFSQRGAYLVGDPVIMAHGQANAEIRTDGGAPTLSCIHEAPIVAGSLLSGGHTNNPLDETLIAHSLRAEGFDASEDGTGRGTPLVPVYAQELADPITAHEQKTYTHEGKNNFRTRNVMAFSAKDHGADASEDLSPTLRAMPHHGSHANGGGQMAVAIPFDTTQITSPANYSKPKEGDPCDPLAAGAHPPAVAVSFQPGNIKRGAGAQPSTEVFPTLGANHGRGLSDQDPHVAYAFQPRIARNGRGDMGEVVNALTAEAGETGKGDAAPCVATVYSIMPQNSGRDYVQQHMAVRRLTPVECERLQGFPDNYTAIPWKKKPAEECPDGPRYKALGNSMAVPVMRWIGIRILEALK